MNTREQDIADVKALSHGASCKIAWSEEGGGDVFRAWDSYILFEIPQYGGQGSFVGVFGEDEIEKMVDLARSWT